MSGKSMASVTASLGAGIANTCAQGAAICGSIGGILGTAATVGVSASPELLAASALTGIGVLVADKIRNRKSSRDHDTLRELLLSVYNDTDELRRRLPFAGKLIGEHLANGGSLGTLSVDDDDPASPSLALYKAIVLHKADTDEKLREILSRLKAPNPSPSSFTAPADETTAALLEENNTALLDLIAGESQEVRTALAGITAALVRLGDRVEYSIGQNAQILEAIRTLSTAVAEARQSAPQEDEAAIIARAHATLEAKLHLPAGTLERELPALAQKLLADKETPAIDIAHAHFAEKQYTKAEAAALSAKDKALAAAIPHLNAAIEALELAAESASAQIQYARAIAHYREAAALTSTDRDPIQWAGIHHMLAYALNDHGQYSEAADILSQVIPVREKHRGAEHPNTLASRNNLAIALRAKGKYAEAEQEHRAVLAIFQRVLGAEHPDTFFCRSALANALYAQGKYAEAEQEHRAVLAIFQRVNGAEHPDTLRSRSNLAVALQAQSKYAEVELEHRAVLAIRQRVLGKEHPDTLSSRNNLAAALDNQGKHDEAEQDYRAVLAIRQRVLGAEHPDTLGTRNNLAAALRALGKYVEAEQEHRAVLAIRQRVLGATHPYVFGTSYNLSLCLMNQGKNPEALAFAKRCLAGWTESLGTDHPDTKEAQNLVTRLESR